MTETITTGCELSEITPSEKNNFKIIFTGVIRTYHDKENTKLKEEYLFIIIKRKVFINHIIKIDNYIKK